MIMVTQLWTHNANDRRLWDYFTSLDPKAIALLLDVDGTLIDIGPSPFEVHVSDGLRASLTRLFELTGGALALVSGRPIADLDRLFAPLKLPSIGGHGAEMRVRGAEVINSAKSLPQDLRRQLADAATRAPASWSRTRAIRWRCITATGRSTRIGCASISRPAARRFPARRPKCCRARRCSKSSGRASTKAKACAR